METWIKGDKAKEITDRLPFDGAIHMDTIGYAGGIWLLWNLDRVEVVQLASTKQEVMLKSRYYHLTYLGFLRLYVLVLDLLRGKCCGKIF